MRLKRIPGAKEAVEASSLCLTAPRELKGGWLRLADGRPLYLEIGMGRGAFITGHALAEPDKFFLGMDIYEEVLYRAELKLRKETALRGMTEYPGNLRFIHGNAALLSELFAEGELERIYLNFSDPWPKARHYKRRLTWRSFWEQYALILRSGGEIYFRTDNESFFDWSLQSFAESPFQTVYAARGVEPPEDNIISEYELKYRAQGKPIYAAVFRKGEQQ